MHSRDAVLRHSRICRLREAQLVPGPQRRGKKRSACDNCAKSKLSCDADFPCEACLLNHRACTYDRLGGFSAASKANQKGDDTKIRGSHTDKSASQSTTTNLSSDILSLIHKSENQTAIPFLRKYVDPDVKSLPEVFDRLSLTDIGRGNNEGTGNLDSSEILVQKPRVFPKYSFAGLLFELSSSEFQMPMLHVPPNIRASDESSADTGANVDNDDSNHEITNNPILESQTSGRFEPPTPERHARFLSELAEFWVDLSPESVEARSDICISEATELLDLTNIPKLITTYFEQWQRHSPILHLNLFDLNTASFPLLLNVALVGALYSSDARRLAIARMLIPVAEKWVFSSRVFTRQRTYHHPSRKPYSFPCAEYLSDFELLQAAFIMIKILLREGDVEKVNEVRTTMFNHIVTVTSLFNA